ncbi:TPA: hypothetical protein EYP26_06000 [Candidatus Bathyarchaeota archaeon]|nr:hypothetical protein [Candidatus Bathyarchaeota archaeon]
MLEIDGRVTSLLDEVKARTGKKLVLIPRGDIPVRAAVVEGAGEKRIAIQYSPERCEAGDLAHELLRAIRLNDKEWRKMAPAGLEGRRASGWIEALVHTPWILLELRRRGLSSSGILMDNFEAALQYLETEDPPYCHVEDPKLRLVFSAVNYALYLLTKDSVDYGERGVAFGLLYRMKDPTALKLGEEAAKIVKDNGCLTLKEAERAMKEIFKLFDF